MKKTLVLLAALLSLCACKDDKTSFRLKGELKGFTGNSLCIYSDNEAYPKIDTVSVDKGSFIYKLNIDTVVPLTLLLKDGAEDFVIFANKGYEVSLKGNASNPASLQAEGGELNEIMNGFRKEIANMKDPQQIENAAENFIRKNPLSEISVYLANKYFIQQNTVNPERVEKVLKSLGGKMQDRLIIHTALMNCRLMKNGDVDYNAPDFSFSQKDQAPITLSNFKGKLLLIQFWASWHPKSMELMRASKDLESKYEGKLAILNVSLDLDERKWKTNLPFDSLSLRRTVCDFNGWEGNMVRAYGITQLPSNTLINGQQKIIGKDLFDKDLTDRLDALTSH